MNRLHDNDIDIETLSMYLERFAFASVLIDYGNDVTRVRVASSMKACMEADDYFKFNVNLIIISNVVVYLSEH